MTKRKEEEFDFLFFTRDNDKKKLKLLLKTLSEFERANMDFSIYGRRAMFALCDSVKGALSEIEVADQKLDLLLS